MRQVERNAFHYDDLPAGERMLGRLAARPAPLVVLATMVAAAVGWLWLVLMAGQGARLDATSTTAAQNGWLLNVAGLSADWLPGPLREALAALCGPAALAGTGLTTFLVSLTMWLAMSVAMMLPSAAPMLRTYADIAQTAAAKGEDARSVWTLALGYLAVWTAFSMAAAVAQTALLFAGVAAQIDAQIDAPVAALLGGAVLVLAGAYQFSALKEACLEKCRNPFATLFARWSTDAGAILRLGVDQGLWCLGCCWALMLVMLAVGTMNLAWMALLALFTLLEKTGTGKVTSRLAGVILIAWGTALCALAAIA